MHKYVSPHFVNSIMVPYNANIFETIITGGIAQKGDLKWMPTMTLFLSKHLELNPEVNRSIKHIFLQIYKPKNKQALCLFQNCS
jgi:hypothetical protein